MLTDREIILRIISSYERVRDDHLRLTELSESMLSFRMADIHFENLSSLPLDTLYGVLSVATGLDEEIIYSFSSETNDSELQSLEDWDTPDFLELWERWSDKKITSEQFADGIIKYQKLKYESID